MSRIIRRIMREDEEPIANLIRMNLTRAGYSCTWAAGGDGGGGFDAASSL